MDERLAARIARRSGINKRRRSRVLGIFHSICRSGDVPHAGVGHLNAAPSFVAYELMELILIACLSRVILNSVQKVLNIKNKSFDSSS
jgi:hypothetical protein